MQFFHRGASMFRLGPRECIGCNISLSNHPTGICSQFFKWVGPRAYRPVRRVKELHGAFDSRGPKAGRPRVREVWEVVCCRPANMFFGENLEI